MLRIDLFTDVENFDADAKRVNEVVKEHFSHEGNVEVTVTLERESDNYKAEQHIDGLRESIARMSGKTLY